MSTFRPWPRASSVSRSSTPDRRAHCRSGSTPKTACTTTSYRRASQLPNRSRSGRRATRHRSSARCRRRPQFSRVKELVADAVAQGLRPVAGGSAIEGPGYFFQPTILADARDGVRIVDEEQFGPALPILRFSDLDDAIERANNTTFGLCGSAWSADADRAAAAAERLECGTTFVNTHAALQYDVQFGGSKWSGVGLENGLPGLLSFTEQQVVHRARS